MLGENRETHIGIKYEVTACGGSPQCDPHMDPTWYSRQAVFTSSFSELPITEEQCPATSKTHGGIL